MLRRRWHECRVPQEVFDEAEGALAAADEHMEQVAQRDPAVRREAGRLREIREQNHFAELIRAMVEQGYGGEPRASG